jgi:hypothetical protein
MSPARWLRCEPDQFGAERDDQQIRMVAGPRNRPIEIASVHLPSKTRNFFGDFQAPSRVRAVESSGFMERAMGIEPTSEAWEAPVLPLNYARSLFLIVVANCL